MNIDVQSFPFIFVFKVIHLIQNKPQAIQSSPVFEGSKTSEKFGTSEYESFRQIVEEAKADFEFLGRTRLQTKLKTMPGDDVAEARALEKTVKKAMEEATKPIKDKLENLKLKIEETEGNNEANMRQSFLRFNPFRMFNPPPPFSGNFGETFSDWIEKLTHFMTLQGIGDNDELYKIAYLESNLIGSALASLHDLKRDLDPVTFQALVQGFKELYPDGRDSDLHQQLLYDRKQKKNESVTEYVDKLRKLARSAYPTLQDEAHMTQTVAELQSELKSIKGILKLAVDGMSKTQQLNEPPKPSQFTSEDQLLDIDDHGFLERRQQNGTQFSLCNVNLLPTVQKKLLSSPNDENLFVDQIPIVDTSKIEFENSFPDGNLENQTTDLLDNFDDKSFDGFEIDTQKLESQCQEDQRMENLNLGFDTEPGVNVPNFVSFSDPTVNPDDNFVDDIDDMFTVDLEIFVENYEKAENVQARNSIMAFPLCFTLNHDSNLEIDNQIYQRLCVQTEHSKSCSDDFVNDPDFTALNEYLDKVFENTCISLYDDEAQSVCDEQDIEDRNFTINDLGSNHFVSEFPMNGFVSGSFHQLKVNPEHLKSKLNYNDSIEDDDLLFDIVWLFEEPEVIHEQNYAGRNICDDVVAMTTNVCLCCLADTAICICFACPLHGGTDNVCPAAANKSATKIVKDNKDESESPPPTPGRDLSSGTTWIYVKSIFLFLLTYCCLQMKMKRATKMNKQCWTGRRNVDGRGHVIV
uniref:Retrotransposon gag domain-containing protein n=1 Tax=Romanomermis culicivorax TaxID=13658 RepID=A0A915HZ79_ROMCU